MVIQTLEQVEMPDLVAKWKNGDGESVAIKQKKLKTLEKNLADFHAQEDKQYDLLETGKYTQDVFDRRNKALREKMDVCEKQIEEAKKSMPNAIDYQEKVTTLKEAIASLRNPDISPKNKNLLLKSIIGRIDVTSNPTENKGDYDFSLKITLNI